MSEKFKNERGVITIYLLLILVVFFFFIGVLVDLSRVMAAKKGLERAANSSARSVLADFNPELKNYGLYGLNKPEKAKDDFDIYIKDNLGMNSVKSNRFLDYQLVSSSVTVRDPLAEKAAMKWEILDEMKYKAPIELIENLVDAFRPLGKASEKFAKTDDLAKLQEQRDKLIEQAKESLKEIRTSRNEPGNIPFIEDSFRDFNSKKSELTPPTETLPYLDSNANLMGSAMNILQMRILSSCDPIIKNKLSSIISDLSKAQSLNNQMREKIQSNQEDYSLSNPSNTQDQTVSEQPLDLNKMVYDDNVFQTALKTVEEYQDKSTKVDTTGTSLNSDMERNYANRQDTINDSLTLALDNKINELVSLSQDKPDLVFNNASTTNKKDSEANDEGKKKKESAASSVDLDQIKKEVDKQIAVLETMPKVYSFFINYRSVNNNQNCFDGETKDSTDDLRNQSASLMTSIFKALQNALLDTRDTLYMNEYVLQKFSCWTEVTGDDPAKKSEHVLNNSEAEYVLYGQSLPSANLALAFSELFATRLAINTVYYFMNPIDNPDPDPVGRAIIAVIKGAKTTASDMKTLLVDKKDLPVWPAPEMTNPHLGYKDYLRLFMILHNYDENTKLARIQSIISLNLEGVDTLKTSDPKMLADAATIITCDAQASIRLWFIPRILAGAGQIAGFQVQGDRAIITQKVTAAY